MGDSFYICQILLSATELLFDLFYTLLQNQYLLFHKTWMMTANNNHPYQNQNPRMFNVYLYFYSFIYLFIYLFFYCRYPFYWNSFLHSFDFIQKQLAERTTVYNFTGFKQDSIGGVFRLILLSFSSYVFCRTHRPYKHTTWIRRWNDVSTPFQRGIHVVCLLGM